MEKEGKLEIINKIKRIERELYLKKSQLTSMEVMEQEVGIHEGLDINELKQLFSQLIEQIGLLSAGGDSVKDIMVERKR
jgi:hypothetical protein